MKQRTTGTALRLLVAGTVSITVLGGSFSAGAGAVPVRVQGSLPPGWEIVGTVDGSVTVVYDDVSAVEMRSARPEFRLGDRTLGYPVVRAGHLELRLDAAPLGDLSSLSAWQGESSLEPAPQRQAPAPSAPSAPAPASAPAPWAAVDPGVAGRFRTQRLSYELPSFSVPEMPEPLEVAAEVIAPVGAPGRRPLVLFLHGRHATCYGSEEPDGPLEVTGDWPCVVPFEPIPSQLGYRYVAELLASQGYVTVSIAANGINGQDGGVEDSGMHARSVLVRHHLALWESWASGVASSPFPSGLPAAVDINKVVLVGHSRGGEGVERAAIDAQAERTRYRIVGLSLIGPTAFERHTAPGIPTATILPYCDGDVSDLQGQTYTDNASELIPSGDPAMHSSVLVFGANHNFFNTEWTPGLAVAPSDDDWLFSGSPDDPTCGESASARLTAAEQQAVGKVYIAGLVRLAVANDPNLAPLFDGSRVRARSAGRAEVLTHSVGANHRLLYRPGRAAVAMTRASAFECAGYDIFETSTLPPCTETADGAQTPHWLAMYGVETLPAQPTLRVDWRLNGRVTLPFATATDLRSADNVDIRVMIDSASPPTNLKVRFTDATGRFVDVAPESSVLAALPGSAPPIPKLWATTVRSPLSKVPRDIRRRVVSVSLISSAPTTGFVIDVSAHTRTLPVVTKITVPRVDVVDASVLEGSVDHPELIRLTLSRRAVESTRLWVQSGRQYSGQFTAQEVTVAAGATFVDVPVTVTGNTSFDLGLTNIGVGVFARSNATTGRALGVLTVVEDDPMPEVTIEPPSQTINDGEVATWTVTLSAPLAEEFFLFARFVSLDNGTELTTFDLTEEQRSEFGIDPTTPDTPLSQVFTGPTVAIPAGELTGTFRLALGDNDPNEGIEVARMVLDVSYPLTASPSNVDLAVLPAP